MSHSQPAASQAPLPQANQLYKQGQYSGAAQAYRNLLQADPGNAALHYDLGNSYFKEGGPGSLGRAIAEFWRAYRLRPRDSSIRYNLDFALKRAGESLVPPGTPYALHLLFHSLSEGELLGLQWIGCWASMLLAAAWLLWIERRPRLKPKLVGTLVFWAIAAGWWGARRLTDVPDPGVILDNNAEVRSGPGLNFPVSFNAPEGRRLSILSENGEWLEIGVLKEGLKGWIPAKSVEKI